MIVFARESQILISTINESILMVYFKLIVGYDATFFIMKSYFYVVLYEPIESKEVLNHRQGSVTIVEGREPVLVTSEISYFLYTTVRLKLI